MSAACWGATWRGEGAKTNPTASAPMATASSASSSLVIPQIFTNTAGRLRHTGSNYPVTGSAAGTRGGTAAAGSAAVTSDSPTSTASKPAAASARASPAPRTPDSATRATEAGMALPHPHGPVVVDLEGDQVALVHPDEPGARVERPLELGLVVHLDQRLEADLAGQGVEVGQLGCRRGRRR